MVWSIPWALRKTIVKCETTEDLTQARAFLVERLVEDGQHFDLPASLLSREELVVVHKDEAVCSIVASVVRKPAASLQWMVKGPSFDVLAGVAVLNSVFTLIGKESIKVENRSKLNLSWLPAGFCFDLQSSILSRVL